MVPDQIIDYTWGRENSYQDASPSQVVHIDFTEPYDAKVREAILSAGRRCAEPIVDGGTYAATQGPRLETAAEINKLERDGAAMVGMTGMPEAALAREAGLPYAALCIVANWAAGRHDSAKGIQLDQIEAALHLSMARVRQLIEHLELP